MSDWRASDRGGNPEPRPGSVSAVVRGTRSALRAARAGESALFFAAGALLARAAAALSGVRADDPEGWALYALAGLLAALAWWLEHPVDGRALAGELDRRLRHQGALVTALELEARARALSAMEALVRERVLERLRPKEALRATLPALFLPLAAPVCAGLLLALAVERTRESPAQSQAELGRLAAGLDAALGPAAGDAWSAEEAGTLDSRALRETLDLLDRGAEVARRALEPGADPAASREELRALERELAALSSRLPRPSDLRAHVEEARAWSDALATELEREGGAGAPASIDAAASGGQPSGGASGALVAGGELERPSPVPARGPPAGGVQPASSTAPGSGEGSWWPPEYDGVVRRWVELRREELERGDAR